MRVDFRSIFHNFLGQIRNLRAYTVTCFFFGPKCIALIQQKKKLLFQKRKWIIAVLSNKHKSFILCHLGNKKDLKDGQSLKILTNSPLMIHINVN